MPISNFRVKCIVDEFAHRDVRAAVQAGEIEFPDAVAGITCKDVTENPAALDGRDPTAAFAITASCSYGQALGEAEGHYEETNSASWDQAADMLAAVGRLTGDSDPTQVNPDFAGWWPGYLPPGDLP